MTQPVNPLDELLGTINSAILAWKKKNSEQIITQKVHALLDKNSNEVVLKLLGFDKSWGKWELDHCNGRSGNSAAGDYLRTVKQQAIQAWFNSIELPELTLAQRQQIVDSVSKDMRNRFHEEVRRRFYEKLQRDAQKLVDEMCEANHVDGFMKLMSLIDAKNPSEQEHQI